MVARERAGLDSSAGSIWRSASEPPLRPDSAADNQPKLLRVLERAFFSIFRFRSKEGQPMVVFGTGSAWPCTEFFKETGRQDLRPAYPDRERSAAMKASNSSTYQTSVCTRVLKLTSGSSPWVVCTLDSVPVILARFESRESAEAWQGRVSSNTKAA